MFGVQTIANDLTAMQTTIIKISLLLLLILKQNKKTSTPLGYPTSLTERRARAARFRGLALKSVLS